MFYIDQTTPEFIAARDHHFKCIRYVIKKKLLGPAFTEPHPTGSTKRINIVNKIPASVKLFLGNETNLKKVIIGLPQDLELIKEKFSKDKAKKAIDSLLNYEAFIDTKEDKTYHFYHGYNLAKNLKHFTCVYCNRLYTHTIIQKKDNITRPAFDHWFPKGKYPILQLSFYNLIPSCTVCNSQVKKELQLNTSEHFHPYVRHTNKHYRLDFRFSYDLEDHVNAKCKLDTFNKFTERSVIAMKIKQIYDSHNEELRELIFLKKAYSINYIKSLQSLMKMTLNNDEIYRIAFGVYKEGEHLHKRPLSKLKKDILLQLGVIK
ncbi:MAG: hypothetical protein ABWZ25_04085 [Chitinophagaceae bacterium]